MYNYSYHLLPLIFFQPLYSSLRGPLMRLKEDDNISPRLVLDKMEKSGKYSPTLIAKLRRREAAEKNLWEGMPMICAAVVAGNTAGLSAQYMNGMTVSYFLLRCAYIYAYLSITDKTTSYLRSLIYWMANFCSIVTFFKAGPAINRV